MIPIIVASLVATATCIEISESDTAYYSLLGSGQIWILITSYTQKYVVVFWVKIIEQQ